MFLSYQIYYVNKSRYINEVIKLTNKTNYEIVNLYYNNI